MKTKLTFSELNTFKSMIPVSRDELNEFFGGGCGVNSAYSLSKYAEMGGFANGLVQFSPDDVCYLTQDYNDYCGCNDYSGSGYSGSSEYSGSSDYPGTSGYSGDSDYSGSSEYSGSSSYSGFSFSYNSCNYYNWLGGSAYSYDEAYSIINNMVDQLPSIVRDNLFSKVSIEYNSENRSPGSYNEKYDTIILKDLSYDALFAECVHATQDQENLGGNNHAAKEYQEHIIGDIQRYIRGLDKIHSHDIDEHASIDIGVSYTSRTVQDSDGSTAADFDDWLEACIDKKTKAINMSAFQSKVKEFEQAFQSCHPNTPGYQGDIPADYNYDWEQMFRKMGFNVK